MTIYSSLKKTIQVEFIKKKRSGIFYLSVILGIFIPLFAFVANLITYDAQQVASSGAPINYFEKAFQDNLLPFSVFFFPLTIIICASRIAQIDHKNKGWQLMEVMPIFKTAIYFSKFLILIVSNLTSIAVFVLGTLLFGWIFLLIHEPAAHISTKLPLSFIALIGLRLFIVGLCVTAFQYVMSVIIKSFIWPIVIGFFSLLLPLFLKGQNIVLTWYPYAFLNQIWQFIRGSDIGDILTYSEWLSILYTIVLLFIGYNWYAFKGFINAFFSNKAQLFRFLGILVLFGVLIGFTLKPKVLKPYNKTVITGTLESNIPIREAYILHTFTGDSIAKIKIKNGAFNIYIEEDIPVSNYTLSFERGAIGNLFFGTNDSIYIDAVIFNTLKTFNITGTRIAENLKTTERRHYSFIEHYLNNNFDIHNADLFMDNIYKEWQRETSNLSLLKTVDNIVPREDYLNLLKKKITAKHLKRWNNFKKKRETLFPEMPYTKTEEIIALENSITLTDEALLNIPEYFALVKQSLIKEDTRELSESTKLFDAIGKLDEGEFKNTLLFNQLNESIRNINTVTERDSLVELYNHKMGKKSYRDMILKRSKALNALTQGSKAPEFVAYNTQGETFTLDSYKGNYLLIDVWASWCGPCIKEAPYFESKAIAYKEQPIKFLSMSIDQQEEAWETAIKGKGKTVQQLRAKNIKQFAKDYNTNSIPRFILIDPKGKFVNATFLRPSNNSFDALLKGLDGLIPN